MKNGRFSFNPHPARGSGATVRARDGEACGNVSILTRPEGRVQQVVDLAWAGAQPVSILTRPEGRVQQEATHTPTIPVIVSILTRPEGRVQPD